MDLDAPADLATLVLARVGQGPGSPRLGPIKPGDVLPVVTFDLPKPDPGSHFAHGDRAKPDERAPSVGFDLTNPREEISLRRGASDEPRGRRDTRLGREGRTRRRRNRTKTYVTSPRAKRKQDRRHEKSNRNEGATNRASGSRTDRSVPSVHEFVERTEPRVARTSPRASTRETSEDRTGRGRDPTKVRWRRTGAEETSNRGVRGAKPREEELLGRVEESDRTEL
jgi:hypothetical protein